MTANEIAALLARQADVVAQMLLPNGHRDGHEWRCGDVDGEPGKSLAVHLDGEKAGWWRDFAGGDRDGGDLIGLWTRTRHLSLHDACVEACKFLGINPGRDRPAHRAQQWKQPAPVTGGLSDAHRAWLRDTRKLPDATLDAYGLQSSDDAIVFPYLRDGKLIFAKYRKPPKQMWSSKDAEPILFGWQAVRPDVRAVIIAEGELDALAWHAYGYPALSLPNGATGLSWIESEYPRLELLDTIYLSIDMDAVGQQAVAALVQRLGRERTKVVRLPKKDANDCLMAGVPRDVMTLALRDAHTVDPAELRNVGEFMDAVLAELKKEDTGLVLPWQKTQDKLRLRPGEVSVWAGINGHGKTQVTSQIVAYEALHGVKCCVASMEWRAPKWLHRLILQVGAIEETTRDFATRVIGALTTTLWMFDVTGSAKSERILEVFKYARRRYGIDLFLLDNLTKCGFADDDYPGQKRFVEALADFARESNCHVMLVAHMRKGESEDEPGGKFAVKGSGGIVDMVSTLVEVWRNKPRERASAQRAADPNAAVDPKYLDGGRAGMDTLLFVRKQNETGEEPAFSLWFRKRGGVFVQAPHDQERSML
ncbi:MAG TPA: AAA family ATPase [Rhodanobacteraceae bacterium]